MLKGIDPRLNADILHALRSMGHGDLVVVADANFPADSIARDTICGELLRMDTPTAAEALEALLTVLPLDNGHDYAARMQVADDPDEISPVHAEVQALLDRGEAEPRPMIGLARFDFYDRARAAFAVIQTGERRFYGCFMLRKGVLPPPELALAETMLDPQASDELGSAR